MSADRVTVGVVIDLPEPHASVIDQWRKRSGDSQAGRIAPHVTLIPPTKVPAGGLDEVVTHLASVAARTSSFTLNLAGTDSFRPVSQVAFVRVAGGAQHCAELESGLRRGLLDRPRDYPFRPHVTVAHDVDDEALDDVCDGLSDFVARFSVDRFSLYLRREQPRMESSRAGSSHTHYVRADGGPTDGPQSGYRETEQSSQPAVGWAFERYFDFGSGR